MHETHTSFEPSASERDIADRPSLVYRLVALVLAFAYGGILASLPLDAFKDRANYLRYAASSWDLLGNYWSHGPVVALANEPVWLLINSFLANFFSAKTILWIIIFVPAVVVARFVLLKSPNDFVWLLLFLIFPQVIKNHIIHLRQGEAIAVFLLGWSIQSRSWRWMIMGIAPFIHSSFFLILGLLGLSKIMLLLRLGPDLRAVLFASACISMGLVLGQLASLLGARQAQNYEFAMGYGSGLGLLFWAAIFVIMCLQGRRYVHSYAFEMSVILFFLATYVLIDMGARIFESVLILVLLAGLKLTGWRRAVFLVSICLYIVVQYSVHLSQPWMGWSI